MKPMTKIFHSDIVLLTNRIIVKINCPTGTSSGIPWAQTPIWEQLFSELDVRIHTTLSWLFNLYKNQQTLLNICLCTDQMRYVFSNFSFWCCHWEFVTFQLGVMILDFSYMIVVVKRIQDNDIITTSHMSPALSHHVLRHDFLWQ